MTATTLELQPHADLLASIEELTVEDLSVYYSVENEIENVRKFNEIGIPQETQRFYLTENVFKMLGEFVGKVPYTRISYKLGLNGFEYAGIPLSDSYRKAAEDAGKGSREEAEWEGYQKIQQAFLRGSTAVSWISPPKIANYSFVFRFHYDPRENKVDEYIIRYSEPKGTIDRSSEFLSLLDDSQQFSSLLEFIRNPLPEFTTPEENFKAILLAAGVGPDAIEASRKFEQKMRSDNKLSRWINRYISEVFSGDYSDAEGTLRAIYNRARDIKDGKVPIKTDGEQDYSYLIDRDDHSYLYYSTRAASVIGGGSCPALKRASSNPLSPTNIIDSLINGQTLESLFMDSEQKFVCPNCHRESTRPVGNECPKCHITKEEWEKKGEKTC